MTNHISEEALSPRVGETRRAAPNGQAALLIDFDNVTMSIRSNLGHELRKLLNSDIIRGKVSIQRAYADWRRYPQYIVPLAEASIDLIFAPAYGSSKKNATDIRLAIDALEIVFTRPEISTFILLSGDSDFSSLVLKLKEFGKYVIGVGMQESSSDLLVQNCDEYYSYNSLSGLTSAADMPTESHDPWELARRALDRMVERSDVMRSDRLKQVMLELDPNFNEKEIGFSKFNRFLAEAASRKILRLHKVANGQYEVAPGDARTGAAEAPSGRERGRAPSRNGERERSRRREPGSERAPASEPAAQVDESALREAYGLLRSVVRELSARSGGSVRDSEVKRRMLEKDAGFDEAELGFRKFSRFLSQAHDEEVVNVERGSEGNYHVSPLEGEGTPEAETERRERRDGGRGRRSRRGERPRDEGRRARERRAARDEAEAGPAGKEPAGQAGAGRSEDDEAKEAEEAAAEAEPHRPAVRPLGRRGGRAARSPAAASLSPLLENVAEAEETRPDDDVGQEAVGPAGSGAGSAATEEGDGEEETRREARRTLGRFRRGGRGGGTVPRVTAVGPEVTDSASEGEESGGVGSAGGMEDDRE